MTRPPKPARPDDFAAEALAFALRWWREHVARMTLREAGDAVPMSYSHLSKLERNQRPIPPDLIPQLDRIYGAEGKIRDFHFLVTQLDRPFRGTLAISPSHHEEDETDRRRLLQLATAGMGVGAFSSADEPVRRLVDLALNSGHRSIEDWELAVSDHLHAIRTRPAAEIHDDLLVDLLRLQGQLHNAADGDRVELQRITAVLAAFHASVLTRLGAPGAALRWYSTARAAADASGDLDLRLTIRGHEAGHSLYGLRSPEAVLRLTHAAQRLAGPNPRPSVGLASITRVEAHALAFLNRREEARLAVQRFTDIATADLPVIPGFWEPSDYRIYVTYSQVYSAIGDHTAASHAQDRILAGHPDGYHVQINARLHAAQCTVVNGGVVNGVRQATTLLATLPDAYRNALITETARRVLRAVPLHQRTHPAITEFREILALESPKDV
jgi:hypothetical protein